MDITRNVLLPQLVAARAATTPARIYLEEIGGVSQSYAQTHDVALRWACALKSLGVGAAGRVLVFMPTCCEAVNVWIGLGWLRATNIPINTDYRGSMLQYVIDNSKAPLMVCDTGYLQHVLDLVGEQVGELKTIVVTGLLGGDVPREDPRFRILDWRALDQPAADEAFDGPEPYDLSTVMYTSGTSGISKGVMLTWANFAHQGYRMRPDDLTEADIMYSYLPLYHVGGTYWLNSIAQKGAKMVLKQRFSLRDFWPDIKAYGCTVTFMLGAAANFVLSLEPREDDADNPLRFAQVQPLPADLNGFERRFGLKAYTTYGSTEIGVATRTGDDRANGRTCGVFFDELEVRLVDANDYDVPEGAVGELIVRAKRPWIISTGYFEMPDATVSAWRNLWFHTGDALRRDSGGNYYFVDRIKDTIRRRGENISSVEVEKFVSRLDEVLECAAVGVPSQWGEEDVKICVVPKPGLTVDGASIIAFLETEQMPRFMIPRYVAVLDELPKTVTGKIQKRLLRESSSLERSLWDRESKAKPGASA